MLSAIAPPPNIATIEQYSSRLGAYPVQVPTPSIWTTLPCPTSIGYPRVFGQFMKPSTENHTRSSEKCHGGQHNAMSINYGVSRELGLCSIMGGGDIV